MRTKGRSSEKSTSARSPTASRTAFLTGSDGPTRRMSRCASAWSAMTLGARPPLMRPMLRVEEPASPSSGSIGNGNARRSLSAVMSLLMAGVAQFRVGGVRHLSLSSESRRAGRPWRRQRARLSVGSPLMRKRRAAGILVGDNSAGGVAFLADDEEQTDLDAGVAKTLGGGDLGGYDSLGIAGTASVDEVVVLRSLRRRAALYPYGWRGHDIRRDAGQGGEDRPPCSAFSVRGAAGGGDGVARVVQRAFFRRHSVAR